MKTRLSQCLESLQEIESRMMELERKPTVELRGHDLLAISEALLFVQHAIGALRQSQFELADVPDASISMNGHKVYPPG